MILTIGTTRVDLREMGRTPGDDTAPVRTAQINLLDGSWVIQAKGQSAREWTLQGTYYASSANAARWAAIMGLREPGATAVLSEIDEDGNAVDLATVHMSGSPRRTEVELLNGRPVAYRWRLMLVEAPP